MTILQKCTFWISAHLPKKKMAWELSNFKDQTYQRLAQNLLNYFLKKFIKYFCRKHKDEVLDTAQKMKFSTEDFCSKCDQICWKLHIWSHLLKKLLMENLIFYAVRHVSVYSCWQLLIYYFLKSNCQYLRSKLAQRWNSVICYFFIPFLTNKCIFN